MDEATDSEHFAAGINLAGERATAEIVELLRGSGVEPVVLKGPVTSRWLRPEPGTRYSTDVDVLVAPGEREAAETALTAAGYERLFLDGADTAVHADTWVQEGAFSVDLHRTVVGARAAADVVWATLRSASEPAAIAGVDCLVPAPPARGLLVALHAAQHGPTDPRMLDDLELVLDRLTTSEWGTAAALARSLDASDSLAAGLALSVRGAALIGALGLPSPRTTQAVLRAGGAPPTSLGFERLAQAQGLRSRVVIVARELVPHPSYMRVWSPLARRGRAGLTAAYVVRPFWLAWWSIPGFRAWARARRAARGGG